MKNITPKNFKKKTSKIHQYGRSYASGQAASVTTVGDPTNSTITILTTVSGQANRPGSGKTARLQH